MKKFLFIPIFLLTFSVCGQEMQKYLSDTREMVKNANYKEALERHIWFHDHALEKEPAMAGVRLSFALADWKNLGTLYPPALVEMKAIRDKKTLEILAHGGTTLLFSDVKGINRVLGETSKTVDLFDKLLTAYPDKAKSSWFYVRDDLFDAKRYDLIKKFVGNPMREFSMLASNLGRDTSMASRVPMASTQLKLMAENRFVEKSLQLIEFAIAANDLQGAKDIQSAAMKVVSDYRLRDAIVKK